MTTQLPRRPFRPLPPPPDGLAAVRHEARRRRRRRTTVAAAGGAGIAAVVTVVALSSSGVGFAVLRPDVPASGGLATAPTPSTSATPETARGTHRSPASAVGGWPGHGEATKPNPGNAIDRGAVVAPPQSTAGRTPRSSDRPAEPRLVRYRSTDQAATVKAARLCGEGVSYGNGADASVGWCFSVSTANEADGVRLTVHLCRDNTTGGRLSFTSLREVDIAVRRGGQTVWDWAVHNPDQPGAHQLSAPVNGCWNWALVWAGNTQRGAVAPHGTYTFVGTTTATELRAYQPRTLRFTY